jgi:hypothetical protein
MLTIDDKKVDLTKPDSMKKITIKPNGYIEQRKDGITTRIENSADKPKNK